MSELTRVLLESIAITGLLLLPFLVVAVIDRARGRHQVPERRRPLARLAAHEDVNGGGEAEKD